VKPVWRIVPSGRSFTAMRTSFSTAIVVLGLMSRVIGAQERYVTAQALPEGREIVAYYFGAQDCGACHYPAVKNAVLAMKGLVRDQAKKQGAAFSVVGVANDWEIPTAINFIASVGPFDQLVLGGNWTNLAIERFIWRDSTARAAMPQIVVIERTVTPLRAGMTFSEPKILRRLVGGDEIPAWVAKGAPISPP